MNRNYGAHVLQLLKPACPEPVALKWEVTVMFTSVTQSHLILCDSMWLQHIRLLCSSATPREFSNSCTSSRWCHPTISRRHLLLLPSILPCIRVFSNESVLPIQWPKYWNSSFSIRPSKEYSGLMSFRIDWLDLLAFQGTLKSLLKHYSSTASSLQCSAFFMIQHSHLYMSTGKTIALTRQDFVIRSNVSAFEYAV